MNNLNGKLKLKVGDRVKVREDLKVGKWYSDESGMNSNAFTLQMKQNRGRFAEVVGVAYGQYVLSIDKVHLYTYSMLDDLSVEDNPEFVKSEYVFNEQVERLVAKLMKNQALRAMDKALDERLFEKDPVKFNEITRHLNN
jgi:hypothetical protein